MIKTKISIDLLNPGSKKVLYTVQGDEYSRGVDFAVYKNNVPYDELDSFSASFSFSKEDGTGGSYDQMPDGSVAYSISENIISVLIAPQVLTSPGFVDFSIKLTRNNEVLHTFSIKIFVQQNPGLSYISENYYKILGSLPDSGWQPNMYLGTDSRGNVVVKVGGGTGGDSGGGIVFFPSVDKDGNLSWSNNGGLENPETVNISGDPGERGLSMYLLNASLAGSAEYYNFSDFVIPEKYIPKLNDLVLYRSGHLGYIHEVNMELESALVALIPGANLSGQPGEKGVQGEPGKDGADGQPGKDGADGKNGKDGVSATHSWNGTTLTITSASGTSSANLKGDQGIQGIQGEPGKDGEDGAPGKDGAKGADGKDGYSIFHTSEEATMDDWPFDTRFITTNGRELQPGDKVLTPAGKLFSIYAVSGGVIDASFVSLLKGDKGDKGDQGIQGEPGAKGDAGENGKDGTSVTVKSVSESTADGGSNVVTFSDGKTVTIKNGSKGNPGTNGTNGTNGTSVTVSNVSESSASGGTNTVTFSDGKKVNIKNGINGTNGTNGTNGVSVSSVKQTTTSSADGGSNVVTVTLSNGTTSTLTVKNGSKGSTGAAGTNGKTPVKGVDYFTAADQEALVQQVIAALGTPVFGRVDADNNIILTGELADGTYTLKYEDAEGEQTVIGTLVQDADAPSYTNQIPISKDVDGSIYNGVGFKTATRISLSSGDISSIANANAATPSFSTGFIPVKRGDVIRLKNCWMDSTSMDDGPSPYGHRTWALFILFYSNMSAAGKTVQVAWTDLPTSTTVTAVADTDGMYRQFTVNTDGAYMRINLAANNPAEAILTINEPIV